MNDQGLIIFELGHYPWTLVGFFFVFVGIVAAMIFLQLATDVTCSRQSRTTFFAACVGALVGTGTCVYLLISS